MEIWTLTAPVRWASHVGVQDKNAYDASAAAFRRLAGALQKATQLPLGVQVRFSSRADLSPSFCTCCSSAMGFCLETALPAGLKPTLCEAAREPGRRLSERPPEGGGLIEQQLAPDTSTVELVPDSPRLAELVDEHQPEAARGFGVTREHARSQP